MHIRVEPVMRADASIGPYNGIKVTYTVLGANGNKIHAAGTVIIPL